MGANNTKLNNLKIDMAKWEKIQFNEHFTVLRSDDGTQAQLYHLLLDQTMDIDGQVYLYQYRANHSGNLVKVLGAEAISQTVGFCGKSKSVNVLTERIPILLSTSRQLTLQQANIVLCNALEGFSQIFYKFGGVKITDKMIGFNKEGKTKVWKNQNFGENHHTVEHSLSDLVSHKQQNTQKNMINNLINIIQKKTQKGFFPEPYHTQYHQCETFLDLKDRIIQSKFATQKAIDDNRIDIFSKQQNIPNKTSTNPINTYKQYEQYERNYNYPSPRFGNTKVKFNYISPNQI